MIRTSPCLLLAAAMLWLGGPLAGLAPAAEAAKPDAAKYEGTYPGLKYKMPAIMLISWTDWPKSPEDQDIMARFIKAHGFNAVETAYASGSLDALRRNGMYARLGPELAVASKLKNDPAVFAYFISDRRKSRFFPAWAKIVREYEAADPNHPTMFNNYAMWNQVPSFVEQVHPNLLTYYQYQFRSRGHAERNLFYLGQFRALALKNHIPLLRCLDAKWNDPRIRMEHYTCLAYGVQGFHYSPCYHFGFKKDAKGEPVLENGHIVPEMNSLFTTLSQVAKEIQTMSPVLVNLKSIAVFHAEPLPMGGNKPPKDSWIDITGANTMVGVFKNTAGQDFLMPVNYDPNKPHETELHFKAGVTAVEQMDKANGKWIPLTLANEGTGKVLKINLADGDGQLLRVVRSAN